MNTTQSITKTISSKLSADFDFTITTGSQTAIGFQIKALPILLALFWPDSARAQSNSTAPAPVSIVQRTNKPAQSRITATVIVTNPGVQMLATVTNRLAQLRAQLAKAEADSSQAFRLLELEQKAGKISDAQANQRNHQRLMKLQSDRARLQKEIADFELREFQIRKSYNMPAATPPRKR